jgi:hypothetical protein
MIAFAMPLNKKPAQVPNKDETPRPRPADNSPFGSAPKRPAKPEYDQRSIWPSDSEDGESRR